jgi:hypothetical protein
MAVQSARAMRRSSNARRRGPSRGGYAASGGAYLFFCVTVVLTVGLLVFASFALGPRAVEPVALQRAGTPVATIQFTPDGKGLCRRVKFHNDSGRFENDGTGPCRNMISDQFLVETVSPRAEALARVFKFR